MGESRRESGHQSRGPVIHYVRSVVKDGTAEERTALMRRWEIMLARAALGREERRPANKAANRKPGHR